MTEHAFVLELRVAGAAEPVRELFADLDALADRLRQITPEQLSSGTRVRWRRASHPGVWIDIEAGGYPLAMVWTCEYCNTRIQTHSSCPQFALDALDRYGPHDHDGQDVTIETAKHLVRAAYAALTDPGGPMWMPLSAIYNQLGDGYRRNLGGRNNPRRTAEIAMVLMGEDEPDVTLNVVGYTASAGPSLLIHSGGWADAILISPRLPKPTPAPLPPSQPSPE